MNGPIAPAEFRAALRLDLMAFTEKVFATVSPGDGSVSPNFLAR
jgi:hypothetical protein